MKLVMQMVTLEGLTNLQVLEKVLMLFPRKREGDFNLLQRIVSSVISRSKIIQIQKSVS